MKVLLINGEQALIDKHQYFPFTYKISDLEEVNIINFPSTKSVMLPRNTVNDDLFGNIAEITRTNFGYDDGQSRVSFNQFKKANYTLMYFSEIVSEGILRIVNITNTYYEVELYDKAIELLEELEDIELNEMNIINPQTGLPINVRIDSQSVAQMTKLDYGVTPVFGNYESNYDNTKEIYASKEGTNGIERAIVELPNDMTPLQLRTFPAGDLPYAMKLNRMMDMVRRYGIDFSDKVKDYTKSIYMMLNKPKNDLTTTEETFNKASVFDPSGGSSFDGIRRYTLNVTHIDNTTSQPKTFYNGNYMFKNEFTIKFKTTVPRSSRIWTQYKSVNWMDSHPDGSTIGTLTVDSIPYLTVDGVETALPATKTLIVMVKGVNTYFETVGDKEELTVMGSFNLSASLNPRSVNGGTLRVEHKISNTLAKTGTTPYVTYPFNIKSGYSFSCNIEPTIVIKPLDFGEYDLIDSQKLLPKMSVKDFVLNIAKTFSFDITAKNGQLNIDVKKYQKTDEILLIEDELEIDVSKVNFSKIKITSGLPDSDILDEYEETHGEYGAQIINTGYTIKKEENEVELPYSIPLALIDYDYFAYNQFGGYLNGGYNRFATGDIRGLDEGLILGFIQRNKDELYVTDVEVSDKTDFKPVLSNSKLVYTPGSETPWTFQEMSEGEINSGNVGDKLVLLENYPTFMPYRMVDDEVVESLEVNKPLFNYGGLTDEQYPVNTTLYHKYHKNILQDRYSADTHVLTGKVFLEGLKDIYNIYNYKNSEYIISELMEYDPTQPDMYEVKLMRVNNTENYTVPPVVPPLTPIRYMCTLDYTIESIFEGDVRDFGDSLGGHESQLMLSTDNGQFETVQDIANIVPTFEYSNGETTVISDRQYGRILDDNYKYKFKVESQLRYRTDNSQNYLNLPHSDYLEVTPNTEKMGYLMYDMSPKDLLITTEDNSIIGKHIEEPILLTNFRKVDIYENTHGYYFTVRFVLTNGQGTGNELNGSTITVRGLNVSGINVSSIIGDVNYSYLDKTNGREVTITFQSYAQNTNPNARVEDFEVGITGLTIQLFNPNAWINGDFNTEVRAVASPMDFLQRVLENITGNDITSGAGSGIAKLKRSRISYRIKTETI